ncbi:MAG: hypothetical protein QF662_03635, partial [Phycisphaerae bacterium]|nr:hypothetical protein [Phycisphaerae bacterium]
MAVGQPNRGVVLIMVLSVLSILALLGVTLVTVTRIDRQAARNYHEQVQAELLAQGALSYVSGKLVEDPWRTDVLLETEAYDAAGVDEDNDGQTDDAWLTNFPSIPDPAAVTQVSFGGPSATVFGYECSGTIAVVGTDNLGTGTTDAPHNWGVWVQDLTVPLEGGRIGLVSLTVVDHSAMVNMNFHGDDESGTVGEVDIYNSPVFAPAGDESALLDGNFNRIARPFSMADEVELRHLKGNRATTQLELAWPGTFLPGADGSGAAMVNRHRATTYSRTSMAQDFGGVIHGRIDINTADPDAIKAALEAAGVTGDIDQIVVNIRDFRDADNNPGPEYEGKYGIERQCFISDAMCDVTVLRDFDEVPPDNIESVIFSLTINLYNPYVGEGLDNLTGGLKTENWRISFGDQTAILKDMAAGDQQVFQMLVTINDPDDENLLPSITLTRPVAGGGEIIIDAITGNALEALLELPDGDGLFATNYVARKIRAWLAWGGTSKEQTIVRIGAFEAVTALPAPGDIGKQDPDTVRPIMIPNCVDDDDRLRQDAGGEL